MRRTHIAILLFLIALAIRILFWQATPDRTWGWSVHYEGDAPLWLEYARAIESDEPFELGLPIHPPATAWLVALLPSNVVIVRFVWILLGALIPPLVFLATDGPFGRRVAVIAGALCAISTGLMILSTSINSETPYLVLVVASFCIAQHRPAWSILNGIACLFRVDHLLFYVLALPLLKTPKRIALSLAFFALPLIPWHIHAWNAIRRFNEVPRVLAPMEEQAIAGVETALRHIPWTPEAQRQRDALPAFARRTASAFVLATVHYRGEREVRDLRALEEAFGYIPKPLQRYPFVSLYGPLNFALANNPRATGGFDRSPLEEPPPLRGAYPPYLVQGLPPAQLTFFYPPHLRLFNDGYSMGLQWIGDDPSAFARLALRKLWIFWTGAAHRILGWGVTGTRRDVDLVVPEGVIWPIAVLALTIAGIWRSWRNPAMWPWLLFLATKIVITIAFFGYARHGATAIPVIALLIAASWGGHPARHVAA